MDNNLSTDKYTGAAENRQVDSSSIVSNRQVDSSSIEGVPGLQSMDRTTGYVLSLITEYLSTNEWTGTVDKKWSEIEKMSKWMNGKYTTQVLYIIHHLKLAWYGRVTRVMKPNSRQAVFNTIDWLETAGILYKVPDEDQAVVDMKAMASRAREGIHMSVEHIGKVYAISPKYSGIVEQYLQAVSVGPTLIQDVERIAREEERINKQLKEMRMTVSANNPKCKHHPERPAYRQGLCKACCEVLRIG